jgi:hypothetical protein
MRIHASLLFKIRRLQLKFLSGEDFDKCYNHLRGLGLRMSTSGERPSTASVSTSIAAAPNSDPSCPPGRLAEINNRPNTALGAVQTSYVSSTVPKVSSPLARHSITLASRAQGTTAQTRPLSASRATTATPLRSHPSPAYSALSPLEPPEYFPRPDSSSSAHFDRPFSSSSKERDYITPMTTAEGPSTFPTVPSTSTMLSTHRQSSEAHLPPRRELPFARSTPPKSAGSDSVRPVSRASSGPMGPPPLPSPSRFSKNTPSFDQASVADLDESAIRQPAHSEHLQDLLLSTPQSASRYGVAPDLPPLPQPTFVESVAKTARTSSSPGSYGVQTSGLPTSAQPSQRLNRAKQNTRDSSTSVTSPAFTSPEKTYQDHIVSEITNHTHENTPDALAVYADRSDDERRAILDDFMLRHIDDDSFVTLVEDVSMCWSRIGLGLG